jgi:peptide/nickel transport system substrate-binding protein
MLLARLPYGYVFPSDVVAMPEVPAIGTGPYLLDRHVPGQEILFRRNPHYRANPPAFARVRVRVVPDAAARIAMVERGEALLADHVPPESASGLETRSDLVVVERESLRVLFLGMRVDRPPFSDRRVRQAVDLAIDRRGLVARALFGRAEPTAQMLPRAVLGFDPLVGLPEPDPVRARALLRQAGYSNGLALRIDGPANRYVNDRQVVEELSRQLAAVGIRAEPRIEDKGAWFARILGGESDLHLVGWACDSGDGGEMLLAALHSRTDGYGGFNSTGLADQQLDRLIEGVDDVFDVGGRRDRIQGALRRAAELKALAPLFVQHEIFVHSPRLHWEPALSLGFDFASMHPVP